MGAFCKRQKDWEIRRVAYAAGQKVVQRAFEDWKIGFAAPKRFSGSFWAFLGCEKWFQANEYMR
jgi:hypothetical protein